jgi:hypothetical protein
MKSTRARTIKRRRFLRTLGASTAALLAIAGCSSDTVSESAGDPASGSESLVDQPPEGTTVDVSALQLEQVPQGSGAVQSSAELPSDPTTGPTLATTYREVEYLVRGVANTYSGPATGPAEVASTDNEYVTRLIARYPKDEADFSGRVFLEPFNTTAGPDRDVIWRQASTLFQQEGDAWVGISVRSTSDTELKDFDPIRYADVSIPTNDLAWDVLRQIGAVIRTGGEQSPLHDQVEHLYMGGYSQSGVDTATFSMSFHDETRFLDGSPVFDGYFPAAHAASMTPLQTGAGLVYEFEEGEMQPVDVPVVDFETQHDVEGWTREMLPGVQYTSRGGASVRRSDSDAATDKYRLFEIAGASHSSVKRDCGGTASTFPVPMFVRAAAAQLFRWAEEGIPPTEAPRIAMETLDTVSTPSSDEFGNAPGGVRSPFVDVPLVKYQVVVGGTGLECAFSGTETPIAPEVLESRYGNADAYMDEFTDSLDAAIEAGFLLESDRSDILDEAENKAEAVLPAGS